MLEGLKGEVSISELCRREGIVSNLYYRWSKDFLEAGKKRLAGDTLRVTDSIYSITLPPQRYLVRGKVDKDLIPDSLNKTDVDNFFTRLREREVDLSGEEDSLILDFIYRAPLDVTTSGLEYYIDSACTLSYGDRTLPDYLLVISQLTVVDLVIEVNEFYGYDEYDDPIYCPLDSGIVVIYDEIFDMEDSLIVLEVLGGEAVYTTFASTPGLMVERLDSEGNDRSFQKAIRATAMVEGREPKTAEEWVLVTGHVAPVGSDFITATSVDFLMYILRDPPGDYSYGYLEKGYSSRTTFDYGNEITGVFNGVKTHMRFGVETDFRYGFGVEISTPFHIMTGADCNEMSGNLVNKEWRSEFTFTTSERYSSSSDELFVGETGDVFIGAGTNFIFSEVSVIEVEGCEVTRSASLGFQPDSIVTTFAYTQQYIEDVLIEELKNQAEYYDSIGDARSAAVFQKRMENWEGILALNKNLKIEAEVMDNKSFSSGADYAYFHESDTTRAYTMSNTFIHDTDVDVTILDAKYSGFEFMFSLPFTSHHEEVEAYVDTAGVTMLAKGYVFSDNNIGDHFTVDIKYDSIYPSPIFDVLAGVSSCPYEPWPDPVTKEPRMIPRDSVVLSMGTLQEDITDLPPGEPAVIHLSLGNASPTGDTRIYELREVSTSNPGGATISANGVWPYEGLIYYIDADQSQKITMTVERGPTKYYYEDLAVMAYPQCEWDLWERRTGGETVRFQVWDDDACKLYNMLGQKVRTLVSEFIGAGHHKAVWDGLDEDEQPVSTGIYLYRLKSGNFSKTMKMALIK